MDTDAPRRELTAVSREPWGWWGPIWSAPQRRSLAALVADGVVGPLAAALLWSLVERGVSLTVAAESSGAGKTTLLTSLLDAIPPTRRRRFVGGVYESFDDLGSLPAHETALLVNEISPHLPAYCWGAALRRLLQAGSTGYQILATIHADTPDEVIASLAADPIRAPLRTIAALGTVAFLGVPDGSAGAMRRVRSVVKFEYDGMTGGLRFSQCDPGDEGSLLRLAADLELDLSQVQRRAEVFARKAADR